MPKLNVSYTTSFLDSLDEPITKIKAILDEDKNIDYDADDVNMLLYSNGYFVYFNLELRYCHDKYIAGFMYKYTDNEWSDLIFVKDVDELIVYNKLS